MYKRDWIFEKGNSNWREDVKNDDFLDGLFAEREGDIWLNVFGAWEDGEIDRFLNKYFVTARISNVPFCYSAPDLCILS